MTNAEAIYLLRNTAWLAPSDALESVEEAVDMAIEALERASNAHPTHECVEPTHECVEMINREDALIAVRKHRIDIDSPNKIVKKTYEDVIRDLPFELVGNSEQLRPKGEWIEDAETFYKAVNEYGGVVDENTPYFTDDIACSKCLAKFSVIDNETERFDFCPHCGADMRGEQNE